MNKIFPSPLSNETGYGTESGLDLFNSLDNPSPTSSWNLDPLPVSTFTPFFDAVFFTPFFLERSKVLYTI